MSSNFVPTAEPAAERQRWQSAVRARELEIMRLEAELAAACAVVEAARSFPNKLIMDALDVYDTLRKDPADAK